MATRIFENVMAIAEAQGLKRCTLESRAGLGNGTIAAWKNGSSPNIEKLQKVAETLGVKIEDLLK